MKFLSGRLLALLFCGIAALVGASLHVPQGVMGVVYVILVLAAIFIGSAKVLPREPSSDKPPASVVPSASFKITTVGGPEGSPTGMALLGVPAIIIVTAVVYAVTGDRILETGTGILLSSVLCLLMMRTGGGISPVTPQRISQLTRGFWGWSAILLLMLLLFAAFPHVLQHSSSPYSSAKREFTFAELPLFIGTYPWLALYVYRKVKVSKAAGNWTA